MELRPIGPEDTDACLELASTRGWPPEASKWRLLLGLGQGYGIDVGDGRLAGCVLRFDCGPASMIAMMVVHRDFGRRGLGTRLMRRAIDDSNADIITLYATEDGRRLYEPLGFRICDHLIKHTGRPSLAPEENDAGVRPLTDRDIDAVMELDRRVYGTDRRHIIEAHLTLAYGAWVLERDGRPGGFALAWENLGLRMLGPVVAVDEPGARALIRRAAQGDEEIRIDVPQRFEELRQWLRDSGLSVHPPAPMMVLGGEGPLGDRDHLYATTNQATG
jgi:GNAT superfamily N-acetyltransferase